MRHPRDVCASRGGGEGRGRATTHRTFADIKKKHLRHPLAEYTGPTGQKYAPIDQC